MFVANGVFIEVDIFAGKFLIGGLEHAEQAVEIDRSL